MFEVFHYIIPVFIAAVLVVIFNNHKKRQT